MPALEPLASPTPLAPGHDHASTDAIKTFGSETPSTNMVPSYVIGGKAVVESLVSFADIQVHLALLRRFAQLKAEVLAFKFSETMPEAARFDAQERWRWFVGLAVDRCVTLLAPTRAVAGEFLGNSPIWVQIRYVVP